MRGALDELKSINELQTFISQNLTLCSHCAPHERVTACYATFAPSFKLFKDDPLTGRGFTCFANKSDIAGNFVLASRRHFQQT